MGGIAPLFKYSFQYSPPLHVCDIHVSLLTRMGVALWSFLMHTRSNLKASAVYMLVCTENGPAYHCTELD